MLPLWRLALPLGLSGLLLQWPWPAPAAPADTIALCRAWQGSHGLERILLGNALGAAHHLTKNERLRDSPPERPVALYRTTDLQQVCRGR